MRSVRWGAGEPTWRCIEVRPGLLQVSLPRPRAFVNVYAIEGKGGWTLVDTAENAEPCRRILLDFLEFEGVLGAGIVQILLTHGHPDHTGLVEELAALTGAMVVAHPGTLEPDPVDLDFLHRHGLDTTGHRLIDRPPPLQLDASHLRLVHDGDLLEAGEYRFRLIETPGHHPGSLCGFDERSGTLLSGDRVLRAPTGVARRSAIARDLLGEHLESGERLRKLRVAAVLPGHGRPFAEFRPALDADRLSHLRFVAAVLDGVPPKGTDAMSLTVLVHRTSRPEMAADGWALGRTLAALRHLEGAGEIEADETGRLVTFRRTGARR
jgi:glyoxylase-like metal-dependent hydrolase (beta-lactamase superfamily II)